MMCISLANKEFLRTINTSMHMKDAIYIVYVIKRHLIEIGPLNVVQICTNNASMVYKAVSIIQDDWPHLYF